MQTEEIAMIELMNNLNYLPQSIQEYYQGKKRNSLKIHDVRQLHNLKPYCIWQIICGVKSKIVFISRKERKVTFSDRFSIF